MGKIIMVECATVCIDSPTTRNIANEFKWLLLEFCKDFYDPSLQNYSLLL